MLLAWYGESEKLCRRRMNFLLRTYYGGFASLLRKRYTELSNVTGLVRWFFRGSSKDDTSWEEKKNLAIFMCGPLPELELFVVKVKERNRARRYTSWRDGREQSCKGMKRCRWKAKENDPSSCHKRERRKGLDGSFLERTEPFIRREKRESVLGGKVNTLAGNSIGHWKESPSQIRVANYLRTAWWLKVEFKLFLLFLRNILVSYISWKYIWNATVFYNIIFLPIFVFLDSNIICKLQRIKHTFKKIFLIRRIDTLLFLEVYRICLLGRDLIESNKCHVYFRYLSLTSKVTEYFASHCHKILRFSAYVCLPDFSTRGKEAS